MASALLSKGICWKVTLALLLPANMLKGRNAFLSKTGHEHRPHTPYFRPKPTGTQDCIANKLFWFFSLWKSER